jgi:hypothetical protein
MNADDSPIEFQLPDAGWQLVLDAAAPGTGVADPYDLHPRTLALLVKPR